jgi:hypothetical protein
MSDTARRKSGLPLVIEAVDFRCKPQISYDGRTTNAFEIDAAYITIRGLRFGPTYAGVDGIRIFAGNHIIIDQCEFDQVGGIALLQITPASKE